MSHIFVKDLAIEELERIERRSATIVDRIEELDRELAEQYTVTNYRQHLLTACFPVCVGYDPVSRQTG